MPEPLLRPAEARDAEALAEFAERVFRVAFGAQNNPDDLEAYLAEVYSPAAQTAEIASPRMSTLLLEVDGVLAGYAQVDASRVPPDVQGQPEPIIELKRFYIEASWHGRGLAQKLMVGVVAEARRRGAKTLWLGVWEHNPRGMAFYRKIGFERVGSHTFVLGSDRQTDDLMVLPLE